MNVPSTIAIILGATLAAGCVSEETFLKTQGETEKARKALTQQTAALDTLKSQMGKEKQELAEALAQEKARAAGDLSAVKSDLSSTKSDLSSTQASLVKGQQDLESARKETESTKSSYQQERNRREALEAEIGKLQNARELRDENEKLKRDQQSLRGNIEHLEQLLQSSQQVVANGNRALEDANRRVAASATEKERVTAAMAEAQNHARELEVKIISEQAATAEARQAVEDQVGKLKNDQEQLQQRNVHLKQERDRLQGKTDTLQRQLQAAQQELVNGQHVLAEVNARLAALTGEREQLITALAGAEQQVRTFDAKLAAGQTNEAKTRQSLEGLVGKLQGEHEQLKQRSAELRHERDQLQSKQDDLHRQLQTAQQDITIGQKTLEDANARLAAASNEKEQITAALAEARDHAREQEHKFAIEQAKAAALGEQTQVLMAGASKTQEDIVRLEKQIGQLEAEKARGEELAMRLSERDQQIGSLRQAVSDRDSVAGRVSELMGKLEQANKQITDLNTEMSMSAERAILAEEERDRLSSHVTQQQAALTQAEQELDKLRQEQGTLQASLKQQEEARLKTEEAEKTRLEQERAAKEQERVAKEEESQRLTKTHEDLTQALQSEIDKGEALVQPVGDRLTIIMIDRVLFDSGSVKIKPDGIKLLKRLSEILKTLADKHIRVEGHTDNVPMASRFRERFPTNWEFSTARATSVIRYLVEQGGLNREQVSASGHADTKPIASNDTEDGRAANRRIEIILMPKDQTVIASQAQP